MSTQVEIAARLVEAREAKGMSGAQLARELGMSQQKYHPYEHDREMKASMIVKVCAVLECSPSWLLGIRDDGMNLPPESELLKSLKQEFEKLNTKGKKKAVEDVGELVFVPEYRKSAMDAKDSDRRSA